MDGGCDCYCGSICTLSTNNDSLWRRDRIVVVNAAKPEMLF